MANPNFLILDEPTQGLADSEIADFISKVDCGLELTTAFDRPSGDTTNAAGDLYTEANTETATGNGVSKAALTAWIKKIKITRRDKPSPTAFSLA